MAQSGSLFQIVRQNFALLVKINLLFIIACIPLITIEPAILALFELVYKVQYNECSSIWDEARSAFKRHWRVGMILESLWCVLGFLWIFSANFYVMNLGHNIVYVAFLTGLILSAILAGCICVYAVTILSIKSIGAVQAFYYAALLGIAKPGSALASICIMLCVAVLLYVFSLYALPFVFIIFCSMCALLSIKLLWEPINKFVP